MQNKKAFRSRLLITTVMLFMGGCGKQAEPASAGSAETEKEFDIEEGMEGTEDEDNSAPVEMEKPDVMNDGTQTSESVSTSEPAETAAPIDAVVPVQTGEPTEAESLAQTEKSTEAERSVETVKPAQTAKPAETAEPAVAEKQIESPETVPTETPAVNDSANNQTPASQPEALTQTPAPVQTPQPEAPAQSPAPVQTPQPEAPEQPFQPPVHEHSWKEHYAETQTWIPNIVVVEDYGEIPGEQYGLCICYCGFATTDAAVIEQHIVNHVNAGEYNLAGFTVQTHWTEPTWGVIGSHEEDQGHYETSTYVDYYYCDCGATK